LQDSIDIVDTKILLSANTINATIVSESDRLDTRITSLRNQLLSEINTIDVRSNIVSINALLEAIDLEIEDLKSATTELESELADKIAIVESLKEETRQLKEASALSSSFALQAKVDCLAIKSSLENLQINVNNINSQITSSQSIVLGYLQDVIALKNQTDINAQTATTKAQEAFNSAFDANKSKEAAELAEIATNADAIQTAEDRVQTGLNAATAGDAKDTAILAKNASESARDISISAKDDAIIAKTAAETAQGLSEGARDISVGAKDDAVIAKTAAETAEVNAETAELKAKD